MRFREGLADAFTFLTEIIHPYESQIFIQIIIQSMQTLEKLLLRAIQP